MRVMDSRNIPHGVEIDVELNKDKDRGISVLKIFGPNARKECTIVTNKCKKHEVKFVKILALEVIQPLLDKFISGEGWTNLLKKVNLTVTNKKVHPCKNCNKGFCTEKNLETHIQKFHTKVSKNNKCEICEFETLDFETFQKHLKGVHEASEMKEK